MRAHEFAEFDVQLAKILFVDLWRPPAKQSNSVTFFSHSFIHSFIHSFTRLVYGDTWAGKAHGVIVTWRQKEKCVNFRAPLSGVTEEK